MMENNIIITGAKEHNLKNIDLTLPRNKLIVFTGLSGSGKSSLAFDTIYAEGQRRYMESLSSYARQFLDRMDKPDVEHIEGLSPAISIDQKAASHNPRSTVGTVTEIYDYLRLLFASIGKPYCWICGKPIQTMSIQEIVDQLMTWPHDTEITLLAPITTEKKGEHKQLIQDIKKNGFSRVKVNGTVYRVDDEITLDKHKKHSIEILVDRLSISEENRSRLSESVETCLKQSDGLVLVETKHKGKEEKQKSTLKLFSERLSCPECAISFKEITPRLFSFNSPVGACPECNGLGDKLDFDPGLVIQFPENPIRSCTGKVINLDNTYYGMSCQRTAKKYGFSLDTPYNTLVESQKNILLYGSETEVAENPYIKGQAENFKGMYGPWEGLITNLRRRYFQTQSEGMRFFFRSYMSAKTCTACKGTRLKPEALSVKLCSRSISELTMMSVNELADFFNTLTLSEKEQAISRRILKEIRERLGFLSHVGLDYLTLHRKAGTLSGGEYQRIRLATQIGSGLTGVLYVLDEPSIGLHQRDNKRLLETLFKLRDLGNTLIVVEHDEETIRSADHIVDIGPGAGIHGGNIIFSGPINELLKCKESITAAYLNGETQIPTPKKRRTHKTQHHLCLIGAKTNNLKNITVNFPLGKLICVTGVSGSGKSSLIYDILHKALMRHFYKSKERPGPYESLTGLDYIDKVITIDQTPIGRTPRSNPATYTNIFTPIRELYSRTKEAKIRGYKPGRFSFNVKGGRCEACEGDGMVKIEMHFLADVYVTCDVCKGKRYNDQTLEVKFKGYTISDVLDMTVNQAITIFENIPQIKNKLKTLQDVGLGYIHLGQSATTLSGGEAQRIKLSKELSKKSTGSTLYLLDEPTTGLHFADIQKLLDVLNRLADAGNTVIVIEHNLDVIKTADHIIDLGPEGGDQGGTIVAEGAPETIAQNNQSYTGRFLLSHI
ncbi:excinuclease ABC subunit UvrA [Thermoproteota archaeon]